jgi:hypothetical protein
VALALWIVGLDSSLTKSCSPSITNGKRFTEDLVSLNDFIEAQINQDRQAIVFKQLEQFLFEENFNGQPEHNHKPPQWSPR